MRKNLFFCREKETAKETEDTEAISNENEGKTVTDGDVTDTDSPEIDETSNVAENENTDTEGSPDIPNENENTVEEEDTTIGIYNVILDHNQNQ